MALSRAEIAANKLEMREHPDGGSYLYCTACGCWNDDTHIAGKRHRNALYWAGQADEQQRLLNLQEGATPGQAEATPGQAEATPGPAEATPGQAEATQGHQGNDEGHHETIRSSGPPGLLQPRVEAIAQRLSGELPGRHDRISLLFLLESRWGLSRPPSSRVIGLSPITGAPGRSLRTSRSTSDLQITSFRRLPACADMIQNNSW